MNNIDKILTGIIQKHSDHTYKGSIYKDGNQGIQVIVNRILKKSNIDIVLKIQTCMLLYLCEHKIKRGYQDEFSIFHNIVFENPGSDIRELAKWAIKNNKFLPQELGLLKNMKNEKWVEYFAMISRGKEHDKNIKDMIVLEKKLVNRLGPRVSKVVNKNKIKNMNVIS